MGSENYITAKYLEPNDLFRMGGQIYQIETVRRVDNDLIMTINPINTVGTIPIATLIINEDSIFKSYNKK